MNDFALAVIVSGVAASLSLLGGWLALHQRPTTLFLSVALGLAGDVLLGTIAFEMVPRARELSSTPSTAVGFAIGVAALYGFELLVQRGRTAGVHAAQRRQIRHYPPRASTHRRRGDLLACGTAAEEVIEGLSIGVGAAVEPGLAIIVGASIGLDNLSEALSIGALVAEKDEDATGKGDDTDEASRLCAISTLRQLLSRGELHRLAEPCVAVVTLP